MPERSGRSRRNDVLMRAFLSFSFSRRPVPWRFSRSGWELTQADRHHPAANAQVASFVARADARMAVDHHDPVFLCTPPACAARGIIERRDREHLAPIAQSNGVLAHDVHHMPKTIGDDECCIWGDDCHLEALMRLRRMGTPCR